MCYFFSVSETFKSPWFLVTYMQCILLIPLADIFSHTWRLKEGEKILQNINPKLKNTRQKCWSWKPSYCGNLSLPSSPLRELDLAWIGCFSDGPQPLGIWLQPSALKRKTGFGMVPSPGNIIYMRATDSFVWAHLQPTSSLWGVWRRPEASWLSLLRKELGKR